MKNIFVFALVMLCVALLCCACGTKDAEPEIYINGFSKTATGGVFSGRITKLACNNFQVTIQIEHPEYPSGRTIEVVIEEDSKEVNLSGINGTSLTGKNDFSPYSQGGWTFSIEVPNLPEKGWSATAHATFFYPEDALKSGIFTPQQ